MILIEKFKNIVHGVVRFEPIINPNINLIYSKRIFVIFVVTLINEVLMRLYQGHALIVNFFF